MKIITTINNCKECRYADHSGAFTPGGAQPICAHPDKTRGKGANWETRVIPHIMVKGGYHGMQNCAKVSEIPSWCPLRKNEVDPMASAMNAGSRPNYKAFVERNKRTI